MEIRGNKNNQVAGNSNIINNSTNIYVEGSKTLPQTKMYKFLEIFKNQELKIIQIFHWIYLRRLVKKWNITVRKYI